MSGGSVFGGSNGEDFSLFAALTARLLPAAAGNLNSPDWTISDKAITPQQLWAALTWAAGNRTISISTQTALNTLTPGAYYTAAGVSGLTNAGAGVLLVFSVNDGLGGAAPAADARGNWRYLFFGDNGGVWISRDSGANWAENGAGGGGISEEILAQIEANNLKVGITQAQADAIAANTTARGMVNLLNFTATTETNLDNIIPTQDGETIYFVRDATSTTQPLTALDDDRGLTGDFFVRVFKQGAVIQQTIFTPGEDELRVFARTGRNSYTTGWTDLTREADTGYTTGAQLVAALAALQGAARLSYTALKDPPTIPAGVASTAGIQDGSAYVARTAGATPEWVQRLQVFVPNTIYYEGAIVRIDNAGNGGTPNSAWISEGDSNDAAVEGTGSTEGRWRCIYHPATLIASGAEWNATTRVLTIPRLDGGTAFTATISGGGGGGAVQSVGAGTGLSNSGSATAPVLDIENPFTDDDESKLDGIAAGATAGATSAQEARILANDGKISAANTDAVAVGISGRNLRVTPRVGNFVDTQIPTHIIDADLVTGDFNDVLPAGNDECIMRRIGGSLVNNAPYNNAGGLIWANRRSSTSGIQMFIAWTTDGSGGVYTRRYWSTQSQQWSDWEQIGGATAAEAAAIAANTLKRSYLLTDEQKLEGIEAGATADQTAAEMVAALSALAGAARLPASAIRDLPQPGDGGLSSVATDATLTGLGTNAETLKVANPFTDADEQKLDGIATGATVGATNAEVALINANTVKRTYPQTDQTKVAGIATGATVGATATQASAITANTAKRTYPQADQNKLAGIAAGAEVNVQADWNAASGDAEILNKPAQVASGTVITQASQGVSSASGQNPQNGGTSCTITFAAVANRPVLLLGLVGIRNGQASSTPQWARADLYSGASGTASNQLLARSQSQLTSNETQQIAVNAFITPSATGNITVRLVYYGGGAPMNTTANEGGIVAVQIGGGLASGQGATQAQIDAIAANTAKRTYPQTEQDKLTAVIAAAVLNTAKTSAADGDITGVAISSGNLVVTPRVGQAVSTALPSGGGGDATQVDAPLGTGDMNLLLPVGNDKVIMRRISVATLAENAPFANASGLLIAQQRASTTGLQTFICWDSGGTNACIYTRRLSGNAWNAWAEINGATAAQEARILVNDGKLSATNNDIIGGAIQGNVITLNRRSGGGQPITLPAQVANPFASGRVFAAATAWAVGDIAFSDGAVWLVQAARAANHANNAVKPLSDRTTFAKIGGSVIADTIFDTDTTLPNTTAGIAINLISGFDLRDYDWFEICCGEGVLPDCHAFTFSRATLEQKTTEANALDFTIAFGNEGNLGRDVKIWRIDADTIQARASGNGLTIFEIKGFR